MHKAKKTLFNCVEDWSWAIWDFNESGIWSTNTLIFLFRNILLLSFFGWNAVPYVNSKNTTLKSCCQKSFPLKQHITNQHFHDPKLRLCVITLFNYASELMWRTMKGGFAQCSPSVCRALLGPAHLLCQLIGAAPTWWCFTLRRGSLCNARDRNSNEVGKFRTSGILGWGLSWFYLQSFHVWELWKLRGGVDGGCLGCVCGRLVVPHPSIWCKTVALCLNHWFSQLLTAALYTLKGSVLCSGFVGVSFVTASYDQREDISTQLFSNLEFPIKISQG